ncbi:FxsA family protein, partial [Candidatus Pseudothioglobus singularis]|nr:FxsA family protein [Candidatus Pseudothioglobus singularis]
FCFTNILSKLMSSLSLISIPKSLHRLFSPRNWAFESLPDLLLTPGFLTDALGLLGLMPWSRSYFINHFLEKNAERVFKQRNSVFINRTNSNEKKSNKDDTIEGEFWEDK